MLKHASKNKIWNLNGASFDKEAVRGISTELGLSHAAARLLAARGYTTAETAGAFIRKESGSLYDPFMLADMDKAVDRILLAISKKEKIVVFGDYDVDGVTSVTVVYKYLSGLGADVRYYIPNRVGEGYGVNIEALRSFAAEGYTLVITVDTGITALDETEEARSLGVDIVITDHHECRPELPSAVAVVNPRRPDCPYPFKELAGVGVAFKLCCAVEIKRRGGDYVDAIKAVSAEMCQYVAIGTVADVMPLVDENRIIVCYGLHRLETTENIGLRALMSASGLITKDSFGNVIKKRITSAAVGYTLAPRINAAGRISSAEFAVELFLTDSESRANEIAAELCDTNRRRQAEENSIIEEAERKIAEQCSEDDHVIVLDDDHWHHGVIGIVCSRLTEKYNLPSILVSFEHNTGETPLPTDIGKGSGRSVVGLNLFEALEATSELLHKYGGHELAAGLSVERGKLAEFRRAVNEYAKEKLSGARLGRIIDIDLLLCPEEITVKLAKELYLLEPFGVDNAQPVFRSDRMIISEIIALAGGKHTKLSLASPGMQTVFTALCFGTPSAEFEFSVGDVIDAVYSIDINEYRGRQSVQLLIRDIRHAAVSRVPERDDFAALYTHIRGLNGGMPVLVTTDELSSVLSMPEDTVMSMLDIFSELSMIRFVRGERCEISLLPVTKKIPLETSRILSALRNNASVGE